MPLNACGIFSVCCELRAGRIGLGAPQSVAEIDEAAAATPSRVLAYYRVLPDCGQETIDEAAEAIQAKLASASAGGTAATTATAGAAPTEAQDLPPRAGGAMRVLQPSELLAVLHGPTDQGWCHGYRLADPAAPGWFALSCCTTPAVAASQLLPEEQAHGAAAAELVASKPNVVILFADVSVCSACLL